MAAPKRIDELTAGGTLSAAAAVAVVMAGNTVQVAASKFITEAASFIQSGIGAISEAVSDALQRLPHTAQYSSAANFNTARDALTGRFGMALLDLTGTGSVTTRPVLAIGDGTWRSSDQGIAVSRVLTSGTGNAHGIDDNTTFSRSTYAYASFDAKAQITGTSVSMDHYAGFEEDGTISTTGIVTSYFSFLSSSNVAGATVTNRYGVYIYDVNVTSGSVTNNYGIYLEGQSAGGTLNYGLYHNGTETSRFGGNLLVGDHAGSTPELRVGNQSDGIALRGISGEGRILGYDTRSVGFNDVAIYTGANASLTVKTNGSVIVGNAALANNATTGFLYIPGTTSTSPSGTPTSTSGRYPMIMDPFNNRLYIHNGSAWKYAALT